METLKKRFEEQKERHEGGNKMIGTGGTSPFGAYGYNPQGIRIGQDKGRNKSAVKVWDQRAVQGLRRHARARHAQHQGRAAAPAPLRARRLRRRARPRRHDPLHRRQRRLARHQDGARAAQQGEGAAADGRRRHDGRAHPPRRGAVLAPPRPSSSTSSSITSTTASTTSCGRTTGAATARSSATWDVIRKYNKDYKLIFVGDATMSPYEILQPGGSVEYNNEEAGRRVAAAPHARVPEVRLDQPRAAGRLGLPAEHRGRSSS